MYYFGPSKDRQDGSAGEDGKAADPAESSGLMAPQLASIRSNPNGSLASNSNPAANDAAYLSNDINSCGSGVVQISNNGVGQVILPNAIINPPHLEMSVYPTAPMHGQATMAPFNQGRAMALPSYGMSSVMGAPVMSFQVPLPPMNCGQFPVYPVQSYQAPLPVPFTSTTGQFQSPYQQVPVPCGPFAAPVAQLQSPHGPFTSPATQFQPNPYSYQQVSPFAPMAPQPPFVTGPQHPYQAQMPVRYAPYATTAPQFQPAVSASTFTSASMPPMSNQSGGAAAAAAAAAVSSVQPKAKATPNSRMHHHNTRSDLKALWEKRYSQLVDFKEANGHCEVPQRYKENVELGRWVKDQRTFFSQGKLSQERTALLNEIGFTWRIKDHNKFWKEQLEELISYKEAHGHCNVSVTDVKHNQLAKWVDRQRRAKRYGNLSEKKIQKLEEVGFVWSGR